MIYKVATIVQFKKIHKLSILHSITDYYFQNFNKKCFKLKQISFSFKHTLYFKPLQMVYIESLTAVTYLNYRKVTDYIQIYAYTVQIFIH